MSEISSQPFSKPRAEASTDSSESKRISGPIPVAAPAADTAALNDEKDLDDAKYANVVYDPWIVAKVIKFVL